jgi:sortase A
MATNNNLASDTFATSPGNATVSVPASATATAPAPARHRNMRGVALMLAGCLLIAAALGMLGTNAVEAAQAGTGLDEIVTEFQRAVQSAPTAPADNQQQYNVSVDGTLYAGVLEVPDLGLCLPVQAQWSYPALRQSPCVFSGSAQDGNLVVAAHNYSAHFGRLAQLRQGQTVRYTDGRGLTYTYQVAEITTLAPTAVDEMTSSDGWDLTMFTCTLGGQQRVTVRCTRTSLSA